MRIVKLLHTSFIIALLAITLSACSLNEPWIGEWKHKSDREKGIIELVPGGVAVYSQADEDGRIFMYGYWRLVSLENRSIEYKFDFSTLKVEAANERQREKLTLAASKICKRRQHLDFTDDYKEANIISDSKFIKISSGSGKYKELDVPKTMREEFSNSYNDTTTHGNYMNYPPSTQMGRIITKLGATEISQKGEAPNTSSFELKKAYAFNQRAWNYLMLPPRIARVGNGNRERETEKVVNILQNDIINYFDLGQEYNTPLKRENFHTLPENQWFFSEFYEVKKQLLKQLFFVVIPIKTSYNLSKRAFQQSIPYCKLELTTRENEVTNNVYINTPFVKNRTITIPMNERDAALVEKQSSSIVIMGKLSKNNGLRNGSKKVTSDIIFTPVYYFVVKDSNGEVLLNFGEPLNKNSPPRNL